MDPREDQGRTKTRPRHDQAVRKGLDGRMGEEKHRYRVVLGWNRTLVGGLAGGLIGVF